MSSILDALEKANAARKKAGQESASGQLGAASALERRLREEAQRHRRRTRLLAGGLAVAAVALLAAAGVLWTVLRDDAPASQPVASASRPGEAPAGQPTPSPSPTPEVQGQDAHATMASPSPTATPSPTPTPTPTLTPTPSPTPTPTPSPTPTPTPTPSPTPTPTPTPTPAPAPRFSASQVVIASDLGVTIGGVMETSGVQTVMIDGESVRMGRKVGAIRPLQVHRSSRLIEAEVDDVGGPVLLFIRY